MRQLHATKLHITQYLVRWQYLFRICHLFRNSLNFQYSLIIINDNDEMWMSCQFSEITYDRYQNCVQYFHWWHLSDWIACFIFVLWPTILQVIDKAVLIAPQCANQCDHWNVISINMSNKLFLCRPRGQLFSELWLLKTRWAVREPSLDWFYWVILNIDG